MSRATWMLLKRVATSSSVALASTFFIVLCPAGIRSLDISMHVGEVLLLWKKCLASRYWVSFHLHDILWRYLRVSIHNLTTVDTFPRGHRCYKLLNGNLLILWIEFVLWHFRVILENDQAVHHLYSDDHRLVCSRYAEFGLVMLVYGGVD